MGRVRVQDCGILKTFDGVSSTLGLYVYVRCDLVTSITMANGYCKPLTSTTTDYSTDEVPYAFCPFNVCSVEVLHGFIYANRMCIDCDLSDYKRLKNL